MRLLLTGATGFIGRHFTARALKDGHAVTVLVRDAGSAGFPSNLVGLVEGDITDLDTLVRGARGADVAVHLAAATRAPDPALSHSVNVEGTTALISACRQTGVRRIVALSSLSVRNRRLGSYAASKQAMERVLLDSGLEVVILRPGLVYGPGDRGLSHRMMRAVETMPVMPLVGGGRQPIYPVHVADVVEAILASLSALHVVGRAYDLVGPEALPLREFLDRMGGTLGRRPRFFPVPVAVALPAARVMARVLRDPPLTVDNVIGASQTPACDPEPVRRDLAVRATPLREGLPTILDLPPSPGGPTDRPLRIAIVGLGKMGLTHTALFSTIPGVRVAALVDVNRQLAAVVRGVGFRVPFFSSLDAALAAVRPDGVVVATPHHLHAPLATLAAQHGAGVLIEKPLAETLEAATDIVRAVHGTGVAASCGYSLAYEPIYEKVKGLLGDGILGRIRRFEASIFLSEVLGPKAGWRYQARTAGGGVIPNLASHVLFLLHWFFGRAVAVRARTERVFSTVDDSAFLEMTFEDGLTGTLETSWSVEGYMLSKTHIAVEGENGRLTCGEGGVVLQLRCPAGGFPAGEARIRPGDLPQEAVFDIGGETYFKEDVDFVRALRTGHPVRTSIAGAWHVQSIIDAAYRSAASGERAVVRTAPVPEMAGAVG